MSRTKRQKPWCIEPDGKKIKDKEMADGAIHIPVIEVDSAGRSLVEEVWTEKDKRRMKRLRHRANRRNDFSGEDEYDEW